MNMFKNKYEIKKTEDGVIFLFYCDLCYHTVSISGFNKDIHNIQLEAMRHFNMCHACGKWVCDLHYNEEIMNCVECAPKKMYCYECGKELLIHEKYCKNCGNKI